LGVAIVTVLILALTIGPASIFPLNAGQRIVERPTVTTGAATSEKPRSGETATDTVATDTETQTAKAVASAQTATDTAAAVATEQTTTTGVTTAQQGWQPATARNAQGDSENDNKYATAPQYPDTAVDDDGWPDGDPEIDGRPEGDREDGDQNDPASAAATASASAPASTVSSPASTATQPSTQTTEPATTQTSAQTEALTTTAARAIAPATSTAATEATRSAAINMDANSLKGKIICLDPGHQRKQNSDLELVAPNGSVKKPKVSSGTAGIVTGDMEYALNLAVAIKLKDRLEAQGAKIVMTRTSHDVDISNIERAKIGNDAKADLVIRIHADGSTNRDTKGVTMLIPSSRHVGETIAATSKKAGQAVLDEVIAATGARSRGLSVREDMTGFNWSKVPVILIEMGFMSNADEDRLLATDEYREKMAKGLYNGCVSYFSDKSES